MYGGTKAELERLIADAASYTEIQKEMGITVDASSTSFDNIVNAIAVVQGKLGIAGATALEAGTTIEGSVNSMKSAWQNLITGLADGNADIGQLVDNLVTTIVGDGTESNLGVLGNVMPAVKTALSGASKLVSELLPEIVQEIPSIINDNLPVLAEAAISIIQSLVDGISQNQDMLMTTAFEIITYLANSLITMLPQIVQLGLDLIISLANGISQNIGTLIPTIVDVVLQIVDTLTNPDTLTNLVKAALEIVIALANGLIEAIPKIIEAIPQIIENIITALTDSLPLIIEAGIELFVSLVKNLPAIIAGIIKAIPQIIKSILDGLSSLGGMLADLFSGAWEGIKNVFSKVGSWFKEKFEEGKENAANAWSNAKEVFSKVWGKTKEAFSNVGSWFKEKFQEGKRNSEAAWSNAKQIFSNVWSKVKSGFSISDALTWGKDMLDNFIAGIKAKWDKLVNTVKQTAQKVKNFLGFSEPKEGPLSNFHTYAPDMMDLFAKGIRDNENVVIDQVKKSFDLRKHIGVIEPEVSGVASIGSYNGYGGTTTEKSVSVVQNIYSEAKTAADLMQEALYLQERSVMLGV